MWFVLIFSILGLFTLYSMYRVEFEWSTAIIELFALLSVYGSLFFSLFLSSSIFGNEIKNKTMSTIDVIVMLLLIIIFTIIFVFFLFLLLERLSNKLISLDLYVLELDRQGYFYAEEHVDDEPIINKIYTSHNEEYE